MTVSDNTSSSLVLIRETSLDGEISVDWTEFRAHLKIRLEENYQYFKAQVHAGVDPEDKLLFLSPEEKVELNTQIEQILILISSMPSQPFTLQRLCELLTEPDRHHSTLPRYLKAVTKLCRVPTRSNEFGSDDIDVDEVALSTIDIEREKRTWRSGSEPPPPKRARSNSPDSGTRTAFMSQSVPNSPRPSSGLNGHQMNSEPSMETTQESKSSEPTKEKEDVSPIEKQPSDSQDASSAEKASESSMDNGESDNVAHDSDNTVSENIDSNAME